MFNKIDTNKTLANMKYLSVIIVFGITMILSLFENDQPRVKKIIAKKLLIDGQWKESRSDIFTYDAKGNKLSHTIGYFKDNQWVNYSRLTYEYDPKTNLEVLRFFQNWKEGQWTQNLRFKPIRDNKGRLVDENIYRYENGEWFLSRKNSSAYSKTDGLKTEQTYLGLDGDRWIRSWKDEYRYKDHKLIEKTGYNWKEKSWVKTMITEYHYNTHDQRIEEKTMRVENNKKLNWRRTTFSYTAGMKTSSTTAIFTNDEWTENEISDFIYE